MKTKIIGLLVLIAGAVGLVTSASSGCGGVPAQTCFIAGGNHLVTYYPTASTPTTGPCSPSGAPWLANDVVSFDHFLGQAPGAGSPAPGCTPPEQCAPDGGGNGSYGGVPLFHPDYTKPSIAMVPSILAALVPDQTHALFAISPYPYSPNDAGICTANGFNPSEVAGNDPNLGPIDITYQWSNLNVVSTTAIQGTQWSATLTYTDKVANCTGTYTAVGMAPVVDCAGAVNGAPDNRLCNPNYNYSATAPGGGTTIIPASGIDPLFPVFCDPSFAQNPLVRSPKCNLIPQTVGQTPTVPDQNVGWFNNAPWLADAGGND